MLQSHHRSGWPFPLLAQGRDWLLGQLSPFQHSIKCCIADFASLVQMYQVVDTG